MWLRYHTLGSWGIEPYVVDSVSARVRSLWLDSRPYIGITLFVNKWVRFPPETVKSAVDRYDRYDKDSNNTNDIALS